MIKGFGGEMTRRVSVLAHMKMRVRSTLTGVLTGFWKDTWTLVFRLLSTLTSTWRGIFHLVTKRDGHFDSHLTVRHSVEAHVELGVDCVAEVHHDMEEEVGEGDHLQERYCKICLKQYTV